MKMGFCASFYIPATGMVSFPPNLILIFKLHTVMREDCHRSGSINCQITATSIITRQEKGR